MKIDLLYEIQLPDPYVGDREPRCYHDGLEQIAAADRAEFEASRIPHAAVMRSELFGKRVIPHFDRA